MKTEADFKEGEVVIFSNKERTANFTGEVDYSCNKEIEGHIRVRQVCYEQIEPGKIMHVPINLIYG